MAKNTSGLGRGLGDLLEDNSPSVRVSGTVVRHDSTGDVSISPEVVESREIPPVVSELPKKDSKALRRNF